MIVIRNIDFIETPQDRTEIYHQDPMSPPILLRTQGDDEYMPVSIVQELIRGRCFRRPDGSELVIGASKQAEEVLGLQYEAWETVHRELCTQRSRLLAAHKQVHKYKDELNGIRCASIWKRLKWLIVGYR